MFELVSYNFDCVRHMAAEEDRMKLFQRKMLIVIGDMLMLAASDSDAARPFFPSKLIIPAIYKAQGADAQKHRENLWKQVTSCSCITPTVALMPLSPCPV